LIALGKIFFCVFFLLFYIGKQAAFSQSANTVPILFRITDKETGIPLYKAHIYIKEIDKHLLSDFDGFAQIKLPSGIYVITVDYLGFEDARIVFNTATKNEIELALSPMAVTMDEVTVSATEENEFAQSVSTGASTISMKDIQDLPFLMGEPDPLKSIQYLPGVQATGEGNGGIFVRGGGIDQNLILFDNAPVFNPNHLFGFFSVFNASVIEDVSVMRGGIPAQYGGRLSSVIEINSKNADRNRKNFSGNVGLLAASFTAELPVVKNKSSLLVSARRTYADLILKGLSGAIPALDSQPDYYFYDLNVNYDHSFSVKDRLTFSFYRGQDDFLFQTNNSFSNDINWANTTGVLRWRHAFNSNFTSDFSVYTSDYQLELGAGISNYLLSLTSGIRDYGSKLSFSLVSIPKHELTFGTELIYHRFTPNNIDLQSTDVDFDVANTEALYGVESAVFINDEFEKGKWLVNVGMRLSTFSQMGPFTRYLGDETNTPTDSVIYSNSEPIVTYMGAAPRLSIRYALSSQASLKASIDRTVQYVHLAPVSSVSLPTDIWVPSSENIQPQRAWQYALGYFKSWQQGTWEASALVYYKQMQNQLEYRNGVLFGYGTGFNFDDNFAFGNGRSAGVELFLKKHTGKLTGWISYTLSRTTRQFEEIDDNQPFPAKYDRLHDLSIISNYELSKRWKLSAVFVYASGNTLTLPTGRYLIEGNVVNDYGTRNNFRMPAYHRFDLSATLKAGKKDSYNAWWIFSIYNLYNRQNPYYIYFDVSGNVSEFNLDIDARKVSLFPILPSVTYRFEF